MKKSNAVKSHFSVLLILFFTISTICYSQTTVASQSNSKIPQTIDELRASIDSLLKEYSVAGVAIALVSKDSIIWAEGIGVANLETGEPVTENTHFRLGSIAKSLVALGFLKLVEDSKIDLNTPIREIIPEIEIDNPWKDTDPVRIVHLLEHTSGFDDTHGYEFFNVKDDPDIPLREVLAINPNSRKVRWKPGTRMAYSSHGYRVARYILEKVSGLRFEDYIEQTILKPIGMTSSRFGATEESLGLLSQGYEWGDQPVPYYPLYNRGFNSCAREMALFVQFMLNRGRVGDKVLLSESSIDRMETPTTSTAARAGLKDGYGLGNRPRYREGLKYYGHGGALPGFVSIYAYIKELGLGCVVLINSYPTGGAYPEIYRLVFGYLGRNWERPPKPAVELTSEQLMKYTGYYELRNPEQQLFAVMDISKGGITIALENDTLYIQYSKSSKTALIPCSPNTFRRLQDPNATIIFTTTETGNLMMADPRYHEEYEKKGSWRPIVYPPLAYGTLIVMLSSIAYALFWIPVHLYKRFKRKEKRSQYIRIRVTPFLAVLSLVCGVLAVFTQSPQTRVETGLYNLGTVTFFVSTLLFAGLSILSLIFSIMSFKRPVKMIARMYAVILSLACFGMTLYLGYWGIIGLRLWAY